MRRTALGFLIGTILIQQLAELPDPQWTWLLLIIVPSLFFLPRWRPLLAAAAGFCWASFVGHQYLAGGLAPAMEGHDLILSGVIASLPEQTLQRSRFEFLPETWRLPAADAQAIEFQIPGKLLLNWYHGAPPLKVGSRWQLQVRLKKPHGFMNPGGFDYEAWLFARGIRATGYVRHQAGDGINRQIARAAGEYRISQFRQRVRERLDAALADQPLRGIVLALAIGDRQHISVAQWETLTRTGTSHLVAISGLHVGLVAGFAFFAVQRAWRWLPIASLFCPAAKAGAVAALLAATAYAMLAGFAVPTQRALAMIAVLMLGVALQRQTRPSDLLSLALIAVLVIDPMAVLAAGFWLSFAAVAIILFVMLDRPAGEASRIKRHWWRWGRIHVLLALGLLPLLLVLFQKASLVAPLANLLAVPWVSLVVVPLTLLGTFMLWFSHTAGEVLLSLAARSLDGLWWVLDGLSSWPFAQWAHGVAPGWVVICALLGMAWLFLPRGMPARWLGLIWLLPLLFWRPHPIPHGEAHFALLDVGQGLAAVVQTRTHVLVFDTGPRFPSGFNTGEAVLTPYLRQRGATDIDILVISHGDNDHIGGVKGLVEHIPAHRVLSSVAQKLPPLRAEPCVAGQQWWWDGIHFEILSPSSSSGIRGSSVNNLSCVLRVSVQGRRILLSGDIERATEEALVRNAAEKLAADILVVPHHGSATSSSEDFLDAVAPRLALFSLGYRNRFGFPKPQVLARYQRRGIALLDTAQHGAIEVYLPAPGGRPRVTTYRQTEARYWHRGPAMHPSVTQASSSDESLSLLQ